MAATATPKNQFVIPDDSALIKSIDTSKYISLPWMTKFEFDQVIGLRTMHLATGAIPFVSLPDDFSTKGNMDLRQVAIRELNEKKLPYLIKRPMPNGSPEYWPVSKLDLTTVQIMMR
jgi:DNA-directed RNA polymerase I, II, and III subunit RPABC2